MCFVRVLTAAIGIIFIDAVFLSLHFTADGITYSFGIMYVEFLDEFNEGKGYTSWILSLMSGMTLCSGNYKCITFHKCRFSHFVMPKKGPISSSFVNKYGCRTVTIAGSILASGCLMLSLFAKNVLFLIITIGKAYSISITKQLLSISYFLTRLRCWMRSWTYLFTGKHQTLNHINFNLILIVCSFSSIGHRQCYNVFREVSVCSNRLVSICLRPPLK